MWEIFGALFGGLYWGAKIADDKAKSREADRRMADHRTRIEDWIKVVIDDELNSRLRTMLETEQGFQILKTRAQSIIRSLPGMEYAELYGRQVEASRHTAMFIEAVKHGKLPYGDEWRLPERYLWNCSDLEFSKSAKVAFLRWVEDTLQQNGCGAHIYLDVRTFPEFTWEPQLVSYERATSIWDENIEDTIPGVSNEVAALRNEPKIRQKKHREEYAKWIELVNGGEMQAFLELEFDEDHWQSIRKTTLEFIRTLPGLELADYWLSNKGFRSGCRNLIFLVEMVKRGKLPWFCYDGIPDYILHDVVDLRIPRSARIAFAQWVENTLKENGIANADIYYRDKFSPKFVFAPALLDLSGVTRITDPNLPKIIIGESEELIAARNKPLIQQKTKTEEEQG